MKAPGCYTCEHADDERGSILRTDEWNVSINSDQGYLGRAYVSLATHAATLSELSPDEFVGFGEIVASYEQAVADAFGAAKVDWTCLMNNAYQEPDPVPHVHWHARPRYRETTEFAGIVFEDPDFGHHYDRERKLFVPDEALEAITERIIELI